MRDSEIEEDLAGGSFLDDPRLKDLYLSKTPKERREMARWFHETNLYGRKLTAKERKAEYDKYFEMEQYGEIFQGCGGCLFAIIMIVAIIYAWVKG